MVKRRLLINFLKKFGFFKIFFKVTGYLFILLIFYKFDNIFRNIKSNIELLFIIILSILCISPAFSFYILPMIFDILLFLLILDILSLIFILIFLLSRFSLFKSFYLFCIFFFFLFFILFSILVYGIYLTSLVIKFDNKVCQFRI